jgi:hypothetical protein
MKMPTSRNAVAGSGPVFVIVPSLRNTSPPTFSTHSAAARSGSPVAAKTNLSFRYTSQYGAAAANARTTRSGIVTLSRRVRNCLNSSKSVSALSFNFATFRPRLLGRID